MAERKQFQNAPAANPRLLELLNETRQRVVTEEELREQRISFAFGNALNADGITKESVRTASKQIRLSCK